MENSKIEELAALMHEAWRLKKIKENGWHIPENCSEINPYDCHTCISWKIDEQYSNGCAINKYKHCPNCHTCVNTWNNLTNKEKELALLNAEIAYNYFNK